MTPEQLAARWLADVARFDLDQPESHMGSASMALQPGYGDYIEYADALAAIARHLAPGDDLVERAEKVRDECLMAVEYHAGPYTRDWDDKPHKVVYALTQQITALLARIAALTATVDRQTQMMDAWADDLAEARKENATMRDRLARMEGALDEVNEAITQHGLAHMGEGKDEAATAIKALAIAIAPILAALTDGGSNG